MQDVYVDADACPVKDEIYRVAGRHGFRVLVVTNQHIWTPRLEYVELQLVGDGLDAADDWIAEHAGESDVAVTADLPLAGRCLANAVRVLDPRGEEFRESTIGELLGTRDVMNHLREMGLPTDGPKPFNDRDRSRFLQRLDAVLGAIKAGKARPA